jgi:hypothetical protein|tara:strand:+ start:271 stop:582 length:312 start_codon:yes stop_codon:yes gene_type:complete
MSALDINLCIDYLKLNANVYKLNKSDAPHEIIYWDDSNPDPHPTDAELKAAWPKAEARWGAVQEIERLEATVTQRRIREMTTADGAKWVDDVEKLIAIERAKL